MKKESLNQFLKLAENYFKKICKNELFFYSDEAKKTRSQLIGLLSETEEDISTLLGKNRQIEINPRNHVNTLTSALSDDYEKAVYCLQIFLTTLRENVKNDREKEISKDKVMELIQKGECNTIEFKVSMVYPTGIFPTVDHNSPMPIDVQRKEIQKIISDSLKGVPKEVAITISAFLNSNGGILIVGVGDDREIVGIENDIKHLRSEVKNIDNYGLFFNDLIRLYLDNVALSCVQIEFFELNSKTILVAKASKSHKPVFISDKELNTPEFYVRLGPSSSKLNVKESSEYIQKHWY